MTGKPTTRRRGLRRAIDAATRLISSNRPRPDTTAPTAWCGASLPGAGAEPIGPCVLRAGHDGPVHQAASGTKWWPTDGSPIPGVRPTADILNGPDLSNGTVPEAFRAAWRRHEMRGDKVPIRLIGGDEPGPYVIDPAAVRTEPLDGNATWDDVMRLFRGGNHDTKETDQ